MREEIWSGLSKAVFDVCVIGGGATGAGCALDAQLRGLRTLLIDAGDFGGATSSASTKLIHGGVRYLEQAVKSLDFAQFGLVRHALAERARMLSNAPHLTRMIEIAIPCTSALEQAYYAIGLKAYDALAGRAELKPSRTLARAEALARVPALNPSRIAGAVAYSDGQFDDARYNLALVLSFADAGGTALNYARLTALEAGAAQVENTLRGERVTVQAKQFINATGAKSDFIRRLANPHAPHRIRSSKGSHLLFDHSGFRHDTGFLAPRTEDGRVVFALPWNGRLLVGTTDDECDPEAPMIVTDAERDYLIRQINPWLGEPLRARDVVGSFAGIRPLVAARPGSPSSKLVRDDALEIDKASGLISIMGGKWTTYRLMAERTVNVISTRPCRTQDYKLAGATTLSTAAAARFSERHSISYETAAHLLSHYGSRADAAMAIANEQPQLRQPLIAGYPAIRAEVIYAGKHEYAMTVDDVLARRIGLGRYSSTLTGQAEPLTSELLHR